MSERVRAYTRSSTPKAARARRENGKKHTRDKLPGDVIEKLGPPPTDAAALRTWNARCLAEVQWLNMRGLIRNEHAATLRANAGAIERALPPAPRPKSLDDDQDDEIDDEDAGPELEPGDGDAGIRVG